MLEYLNNNALFGTIFIFMVTTLAVLGVRFKLFHNFSVPYIIGWLIELLCPVLILLFDFIDALASAGSSFNLLGMTLNAFVFLISALVAVALAALLFRDSTLINQLTYVEQNQLEGHVLAYVSPDFKLIDTTELFRHHFSVDSDWRSQIKGFIINDKAVEIKNILPTIKSLQKGSLNGVAFTATVILKDQDSPIVEECAIKAMYQIHHLMAYAIVVAEDTYTESYLKSQARQAKKELYTYFDIVNEPVAYYDSTLKLFNLNKTMASLINETKEELTIEEFKQYLKQDDQAILASLLEITEEEKETITSTYITLKTINGENYFKVAHLQNEGKTYILLTLTQFEELTMPLGTEQGFSEALNQKETRGQALRCLGLHFLNTPDISTQYGADILKAFIKQYFVTCVQDKIVTASSIYELNNGDYAILFDNYQDYMMASQDISLGISKMLHMNCYLGSQSTILHTAIVSLDSTQVACSAFTVCDMLKNYLTQVDVEHPYYVITKTPDAFTLAQEAHIELEDNALDSILNK